MAPALSAISVSKLRPLSGEIFHLTFTDNSRNLSCRGVDDRNLSDNSYFLQEVTNFEPKVHDHFLTNIEIDAGPDRCLEVCFLRLDLLLPNRYRQGAKVTRIVCSDNAHRSGFNTLHRNNRTRYHGSLRVLNPAGNRRTSLGSG